MTHVWHCSQGHRWEGDKAAAPAICPMCGAATVSGGGGTGTVASSKGGNFNSVDTTLAEDSLRVPQAPPDPTARETYRADEDSVSPVASPVEPRHPGADPPEFGQLTLDVRSPGSEVSSRSMP